MIAQCAGVGESHFWYFFSSTDIQVHQSNFWGGTRSKKFTGRFSIVLHLLVQFSLKTGLLKAISSENWQKRLLCELKLSDDDDLYLVRSVLMRPCVLFKKNSLRVTFLRGGSKIPPKWPSKRLRNNCAMCWGRRVSFLNFFFFDWDFHTSKQLLRGY